MGGEFLGEFEQMVLLAILRRGDDAYGWTVAQELETVAERTVSSGALYPPLDRLEKKGLIRSWTGDGGPARAGRPRRYLAVTATGARALEHARSAMDRLWSSVQLRGIR